MTGSSPDSQSTPDSPSTPDAATTPDSPASPASAASPEPRSSAASPASALGLFRFTIEGRHAPGLFVAGWLATVMGGSGAFVGLLAGQTIPGAVLFAGGLAITLVGLVLLGGSQAIERRAAGVAYAGPSPILVFATIIVGLYIAVVVVVTPLRLLGVRLDGPGLSLLGIVIQTAVVVGIVRVLVVGQGALSWGEMGVRAGLPVALRELTGGAVLAVPVILVTALTVAALVTITGSTPESPLPPAGSPGGLAINLLAGAVIAPIYEELLFRGFATTAWARVVSPGAAIVRTSLLFAFAHLLTQGGASFSEALGIALVAGVARLPVAFALGWVYLRRRSLWAAIGLHAAYNGILLLLAEVALRA